MSIKCIAFFKFFFLLDTICTQAEVYFNFDKTKNTHSFCSQFTSSYDCSINNCHWLKEKCYKVSSRYLGKKIKSISLSLPSKNSNQNSSFIFENCNPKQNTSEPIKCHWKLKPYSPENYLAIHLTQKMNGEFIFGFHVKYYNGKKKSHFFYKEKNEEKESNFYELGTNIKEIVFELISFDKVSNDMFNAEIIYNKSNQNSLFTQESFVIFVLIGNLIFFLFFLFNLVRIFIRKYKEKRQLQLIYMKQQYIRIAKQKEIKLFINKHLKSTDLEQIPFKKYSTNSCPICLEEFKCKIHNIVQLKCKHIFHSKCLNNWMMEKYLNPFCPICHDVIYKNDITISIDDNNFNESLLL